MDRKKFIYTIFGILFAITLVFHVVDTVDRKAFLQEQADEPLHEVDLVRETRRIFNDTFPDHNQVHYSPDNQTVNITVWSDSFTPEKLNYALLEIDYLRKWNTATHSLVETNKVLKEKYVEFGFPNLIPIINLVNPNNHSQVFATVEGEQVVYDIVDATSPGEPIPGTSFDSLVTGSVRSAYSGGNSSAHNIVLNTNTHVFHNTSCPRIKDMNAANAKDFYGSIQDAIDYGYTPCQICGG